MNAKIMLLSYYYEKSDKLVSFSICDKINNLFLELLQITEASDWNFLARKVFYSQKFYEKSSTEDKILCKIYNYII